MPEIELDITRQVAPSMSETGTVRLGDIGMEDALLDTDSLLEVRDRPIHLKPILTDFGTFNLTDTDTDSVK